MNEKISKSLSFLENTQIKLLSNSADDPVERYNTLCKLYLSDNFLKNVGLGSLSAVLLKASIPKVTISPLTSASTALATTGTSTALATTGSTALSTTLAGGTAAGGGAAVAGGSSVLPVIGPVIATAISGWYVGKAIGNLVLENIVYAQKFKSESEILGTNVNTLKAYCKSMEQLLESAIKDAKNAIEKVDKAAKKIKNSEYSTKKTNIDRMQKRKTELATIVRDMGSLREVLVVINENLSKIN